MAKLTRKVYYIAIMGLFDARPSDDKSNTPLEKLTVPTDILISRLALWLAFLAGLAGCVTGNSNINATRARPGTAMMLQGSLCFGTCPEFEATFTQDGKVTFNGKSHVAAPGKHRMIGDPAEFRALWSVAQAQKLLDLDADTINKACRDVGTDNPSTKITFVDDRRTQVVSRYHGCQGHVLFASLDGFATRLRAAMRINHLIAEPEPLRCSEVKPQSLLHLRCLIRTIVRNSQCLPRGSGGVLALSLQTFANVLMPNEVVWLADVGYKARLDAQTCLEGILRAQHFENDKSMFFDTPPLIFWVDVSLRRGE